MAEEAEKARGKRDREGGEMKDVDGCSKRRKIQGRTI